MANWTDGPEYAPTERPVAFETPLAEPLLEPPAVLNPAEGAPFEQPGWQPPQVAVAPLESLVPAAGLSSRDPQTAFTTTSSTATGDSAAWGSAHSATGTLDHPGWTPDQPLVTSGITRSGGASPAPNSSSWPAPAGDPAAVGTPARGLNFPPPQQAAPSFPQPGTPDWFAPAQQGQWRPPDQTVTVAQMWHAATPGVLIPLVIGALVNPLSVVMLGVAALLATRVKYRLSQVRRTFAWSFGLLAVVGAMGLFNSDLDLDTAWSVLSGWAQLLCWAVPIIVLLQVGAGIRANERPNRP